jgi:hypothetical protein
MFSVSVIPNFPMAGLCAAFQGMFGDVLQYCFHDFIFSFLIAAWYFVFLWCTGSFYVPSAFRYLVFFVIFFLVNLSFLSLSWECPSNKLLIFPSQIWSVIMYFNSYLARLVYCLIEHFHEYVYVMLS